MLKKSNVKKKNSKANVSKEKTLDNVAKEAYDSFDMSEFDFIPLVREDSDEHMTVDRNSTDKTENLPVDQKSKGLKIMEFSSSSLMNATHEQPLVSPIKKSGFSAFAYVLESQLNDHALANTQSNTIIDELISNALLCHKRLSDNLPAGVSRESVKSPRASDMNKAHDVVKKLLTFCDIFEQLVYDIRILQQNMQYQINHNQRIKEDSDREMRDLEQRFRLFHQQHEKKAQEWDSMKIKLEFEAHHWKNTVEDNELEIKKLKVDKAALQQKIDQQLAYIETIPGLEDQYIRSARSIVYKSNMAISQRENKLQQYQDELKELTYYKVKTQELGMELNAALKNIKGLEQNMRKMQSQPSIPPARRTVESSASSIGSSMRRKAFASTSDTIIVQQQDRVHEHEELEGDGSYHIDSKDKKGMIRQLSDALTYSNDGKNSSGSNKHITFNLPSSNSRPKSATVGGSHRSNTISSLNHSHNQHDDHSILEYKNIVLTKKNAELKEQVAELSMKLANARAYPLYNASFPSHEHEDRNSGHRHAILKHQRPFSAIERSTPNMTTSNDKNIDDNDDDGDDDIPDDEEDSVEYIESEAEKLQRQQRREEIINLYETKIRHKQPPIDAYREQDKRFHMIRKNRNFAL